MPGQFARPADQAIQTVAVYGRPAPGLRSSDVRLDEVEAQRLAEDRLAATLITDGHHLPAPVVKAMIRAKGAGRVAVVSSHRLRPEALNVKIDGLHIGNVAALTLEEFSDWVAQVTFTAEREKEPEPG